jgi:hypothetical protein
MGTGRRTGTGVRDKRVKVLQKSCVGYLDKSAVRLRTKNAGWNFITAVLTMAD